MRDEFCLLPKDSNSWLLHCFLIYLKKNCYGFTSSSKRVVLTEASLLPSMYIGDTLLRIPRMISSLYRNELRLWSHRRRFVSCDFKKNSYSRFQLGGNLRTLLNPGVLFPWMNGFGEYLLLGSRRSALHSLGGPIWRLRSVRRGGWSPVSFYLMVTQTRSLTNGSLIANSLGFLCRLAK